MSDFDQVPFLSKRRDVVFIHRVLIPSSFDVDAIKKNVVTHNEPVCVQTNGDGDKIGPATRIHLAAERSTHVLELRL